MQCLPVVDQDAAARTLPVVYPKGERSRHTESSAVSIQHPVHVHGPCPLWCKAWPWQQWSGAALRHAPSLAGGHTCCGKSCPGRV